MATVGQLTADKKALDPRTIVENEEAIDNITQAYVGLIIYNKENGKLYKVTEINSLSGKVVNSIVLSPSSIGAQPEINNSNKLSADNIADGTTNKVVTQTEKTTWDNKQDALSSTQLANITKGGTALQPAQTATGLLKDDGTVDTETQSKAANAIQMPSGASADKVLGYDNGAVAWVEKPSNGQDGAQGPQGIPGHNPCLGRLNAVPADFAIAFPDAIAGDYVYVDIYDSTTQTTTTTVYHYVDDTNGWDSGTVIDAEHPTFASRQPVTAVHIKDENGDDVSGSADVLSAKAGKTLGEEIYGKTETIYKTLTNGDDVTYFTDKYYNGSSASFSTQVLNNGGGDYAGTTSFRVDNVAGRQFRIYGLGDTEYICLIIWLDSSREKISTVIGDYRNDGYIAIPPENAYYMIGNFVDYNSDSDYIQEKLTKEVLGIKEEVENHTERLEDLENHGTINVIDNLQSESSVNALSAKQGKALNDKIEGVYDFVDIGDEVVLNANKFINAYNNPITISSFGNYEGCYCCVIPNVGGRRFKIFGEGNDAALKLLIFADSNLNRIGTQTGNYRESGIEVIPPDNSYYMCINFLNYNSETDKVEEWKVIQEGVKQNITLLREQAGFYNAAIYPLLNKNVVFFGDSLSYFTQTEAGGKNMPGYFQSLSNANVYNAAIGGTLLKPRGSIKENITSINDAYTNLDIAYMVDAWAIGSFTNQIAAADYIKNNGSYDYTPNIQALSDCPVNNANIVIIGGGTNDFNSGSSIGNDGDDTLSTLIGSINHIITSLLNTNPKLQIFFWTPIVSKHKVGDTWIWCDEFQNSLGLTKPQFISTLEDTVKMRHIPIIDMYWTLGWDEVNFGAYLYPSETHNGDYIHPYRGFNVLAERIYRQVIPLSH